MLAEATKCREEQIDIASCNAGELVSLLKQKHSALGAMDFKVALDKELVEDDARVNDHMEIALLPPFAGG
ncbi:hypothetical protein GWK08_00300 [Leptobacterium flavescens]|uniref:MoaD/ThiS family protein n=1 Tax=Leptobacterium flavescens TaxID=472055 RepID=A0A6P0UJ52_9FLAO|nr:MoaD/ThiS family protein [Leptobacterium flavescens]NER11869.1 hypothetical protein [Leptobacterium flavescens]